MVFPLRLDLFPVSIGRAACSPVRVALTPWNGRALISCAKWCRLWEHGEANLRHQAGEKADERAVLEWIGWKKLGRE
jgi:hypothetical protein